MSMQEITELHFVFSSLFQEVFHLFFIFFKGFFFAFYLFSICLSRKIGDPNASKSKKSCKYCKCRISHIHPSDVSIGNGVYPDFSFFH